MAEILSLLLINAMIGLTFGLSFTLTHDLYPRVSRWTAPVAVGVWGVVVLLLSLLDHPADQVGRRILGSLTTLWVAYLLYRHATDTRPGPAQPLLPSQPPPPAYRRRRSDRRYPTP